MQNFKKSFGILITCLLLMCALPMSVFAAETTYDLSVAGDNSVIATYDDSTYTLTISGTGATKDYSSSGNPIGRKLSNVKSIIIEEGITHLGNYLFNYTSGSYSTPNLTSTSIVLPSTLKSIGNYTFQYVKAANGTLTMTIPASVESIGEGAFASSNFTAISFEENSKLTEIPEKAFYNMTKISELNIPEGVAFIGDLAFGSSKIANLTLPSTITTLNYGALRNMEYVEDIKINSAQISSVGTYVIDRMGKSVSSSKTARVHASEKFLIDGLEALGYTVTTFGSATEQEGWDSYPSSYAQNVGKTTSTDAVMYYNPYSGVVDIIGSGEITGTSSGAQFIFSDATSIIVHEGITNIPSNGFRSSKATSISLPSTLTTIEGYALYNNVYLTSLVIPKNVESIGYYAIANMNKLETLTFESGSKLQTIGDTAFINDYALTSVTLPSSVEEIGSKAFANCNNLAVITNLANKNQTVGSNAFTATSSSAVVPTVYLYSANTGMIAATSTMKEGTTVIYLDEPVLSGTLENGVTWTYDPVNQKLTFSGDGDIPSYSNGSQPWYGAASQYGGVGTYIFGDGITGIGSGVFGSYGSSSYGSNGSGSTIYGSSGLDYSAAGGGGASYGGTASDAGSGSGSGSGESGSGEGGSGEGGNTESSRTDDVKIIVDATPTYFEVTVPIIVSVNMDKWGHVDVASGYTVDNNCALGPVVITDIKVVSAPTWTIVDYNSDFANMKASSNKFGMTINGAEVSETGSVVLNDSLTSSIMNGASKDLSFDFKFTAQKVKVDSENIAAIVFTVDFDKV